MLSDLKIEKSDLLNKFEVLKDVIEKENLLKAPPLIKFSSLHEEFDSMKYQIENNLEQITLELTEKLIYDVNIVYMVKKIKAIEIFHLKI